MTDILEIIRPHVHLERQGKNYVGLCPFHQEKTPSFTVDPSEQAFCCLGCGAHGDAGEFTKLMLIKGSGAVLNVNLHVAPNFTGRVVVQLKEGRHVCDYRSKGNHSDDPVLFYVLPTVFRTEVARGFDSGQFARTLCEAGILKKSPSDKGYQTLTPRLRHVGNIRLRSYLLVQLDESEGAEQ